MGAGSRLRAAVRAELLGALVLLVVAASPAPAQRPDELAGVRATYLEAVSRRGAIDEGLRTVDSLRSALGARPGTRADALLTGYQGALITLRAKHAAWPPARLRHLREGLRVLDRVVAAHPGVAEVRYLRLMSCYYLPSVLGRSGSVREDFRELARLLPGVEEEYPPRLYRTIVRFVLEHGRLSEEQRRPLVEVLASSDE